MNERPDDDLISAYLDGELAPAETAEVEKLLAESPEARQLLEDFRALGTGLRGLPKLHLGDDFRDRVLRQAERSALSGDVEAVRPAPATGSGADGASVFRIPRTWQGWKWATLATAAALAIWVFGRGALEQPRQVAIAPAEQAPLPPAPVSAPRKTKQGLDERRGAPVSEHFDVLELPPAEPAVELQETPEMLNRAERPLVAADAPAAASAAPLAAGRRRSKAAAEPEALAPAPQDVSPEGRKDADAATLADSVEFKLRPAKVAGGVEAGAALGAEVTTPEPETLAIDVVVPQPEAASAALTQAFLKNRIVLEPEPAAGEAPATPLANSIQGGAGLNSSPASADFADQPVQAAAPAAPAVAGAAQNAAVAPPPGEQNGLATTMSAPDAKLFAFQMADDQQAQLYYVEATEAQVQQTIEDLKAQPQVFYSVLPLTAPPQGQQEPTGAAAAVAETPNLADAQPVEEKAAPFAEAGQAADSLGETVEAFSAAAKKEGLTELNAAAPADAGAVPAATRGLAELETRGEDRFRAAAPVNNAEPLDAAAPANATADKEAAVDLARDEKSQLGKSQELRYATPEQSLQRRMLTQQQAQQTGRAYRLNVPQTQRALGRGPSAGGGYSTYGRGLGGQAYGLPGAAARGGLGGMGSPGPQLQIQARQTGDSAARAAQAATAPEGVLAEESPAADPQRTVRAYFYLRRARTLPAAAGPAPAATAPAAPTPGNQ